MGVWPPPIYVHFLDRELGDAFEFNFELASAQRALATLTLGTASPLICSISALLENEGLRGGEGMIEDLVGNDVLLPQSTHATLSEFLESRRTMYEHDKDRYPLYFGSPLGGLDRLQPRLVPGSTTERLHDKLIVWTEGQSTLQPPTTPLPLEPRNRMLGVVAEELSRRDDRAVTFAMFGAVVANDPSGLLLERTVRRRISLEYADIQRGEHGQLATGLRLPLELVERALQGTAPFERDFPILRTLLQAAGLTAFLEGWPRNLWQPMLPLRGGQEHRRMVSRIQWIAAALEASVPQHASRDMRRQDAITALKPHLGLVRGPRSSDAEAMLIAAQRSLDGLAERLAAQGMKGQLDAAIGMLEPLQADVLLVVVTDVELRETLREFGYPPERVPRTHPKGLQIYFELDVVAGRRVFLVRSNMASGGAGGSLFTVGDAITDLSPDWVLTVGIAYGVDPDTQRIGDVLVPTEIVPHDHKRVGTENGKEKVEFRDGPERPDVVFLARLGAGTLGFTDAEIRRGPVLSGSDLVDNQPYRDHLVNEAAAGRAIGGEMELHGVAAAAARHAARWGAVKGICDFADGNKGEDKAARQELAARNAARYARFLIERGVLDPPR